MSRHKYSKDSAGLLRKTQYALHLEQSGAEFIIGIGLGVGAILAYQNYEEATVREQGMSSEQLAEAKDDQSSFEEVRNKLFGTTAASLYGALGGAVIAGIVTIPQRRSRK